MENPEITETKLLQSGWRKVANTFYKNTVAITHFDTKFRVWLNGENHEVKTMQEIRFFAGELQDVKKPG